MTEKLFCRRCGWRIWRHGDERPYVDLYFDDKHTRCDRSLAMSPPIVNNRPLMGYKEHIDGSRNAEAKTA